MVEGSAFACAPSRLSLPRAKFQTPAWCFAPASVTAASVIGITQYPEEVHSGFRCTTPGRRNWLTSYPLEMVTQWLLSAVL